MKRIMAFTTYSFFNENWRIWGRTENKQCYYDALIQDSMEHKDVYGKKTKLETFQANTMQQHLLSFTQSYKRK